MKTNMAKIFFTSIAVILIASCKKSDKNYDCYFFANANNSKNSIYLFLNDGSKGKLPVIKVINSPVSATTNDTILQNAVHMILKSGKYKIEGKDSLGNVRSSGTLNFKTNSVSNVGSVGKQISTVLKETVVTEVYDWH